MTKAEKKSNKQKAPPPNAVESGSDESSEEEEEMEVSPAPAKNALKRTADKAQEKASKKAKKAAPPNESSDDEASDEEESEDEKPKGLLKVTNITASIKDAKILKVFTSAGIAVEMVEREDNVLIVKLEDPEQADAAIALSGKTFKGAEIEISKETRKIASTQKKSPQKTEKVTKPAAKTGDSKEGTRLFVKNLPNDIELDELRSLIEQEFPGSIVVCIPKSQGKIKGFAFLEFGSSAEVDNAIENKQGAMLGGRALGGALFLEHFGKKVGNDTLLFVKNLPEGYSEDEMRSMLVKHFSDTNEVRLPTNPGGDLKGFAFVQFSTSAALNTALNDLQGSDLKGSSLFLDRNGPRARSKSQIQKPDRGGDRGRGGRGGRDRGRRKGRGGKKTKT